MADCSKTEVFLAEQKRMCLSFECEDCPLSESNNGSRRGCFYFSQEYPVESVAAVQKWSDEHHEPKPKTYADVFLEKFPKASKCYFNERDYVNGNGFPEVRRCNVYGVGIHGCKEGRCTREKQMKCWKEPYKEELRR